VRAAASGTGADADASEHVSEDDADLDGMRVQILTKALGHVAAHGWTTEALARGAEDHGFSPALHGLFPRGPVELVEHFVMESNMHLSTKMLMLEPEDAQSESDFTKTALKWRLEMILPYRHGWEDALGLTLQPNNMLNSMRTISMMLDDVAYQAGDRSTDSAWYAKRAGLVGVYGSTELFMLQDNSLDYENTWKFLDRRVDELAGLTHKPSDVGAVLTSLARIAGPVVGSALKNTPFAHFQPRR